MGELEPAGHQYPPTPHAIGAALLPVQLWPTVHGIPALTVLPAGQNEPGAQEQAPSHVDEFLPPL